ncbi:MAG: hypothetical protein RJA19_514 [Bacteroidota bacterium]|jgi:thiol-disulfide isomerase/thioredoxin
MMKNLRTWAALLGLGGLASTAEGQLPDWSPAPDWTAVDLNGQSHHLQSYLDSGYTVLIDFSATWCGPCWNYHQSGILEQLYEAHGPDGTNTLRVFFIEGDDNTTLADLQGTGPATAGNWIAGTPYPIIDDGGAIFDAYAGNYFPTIYTICPHGLLRESGQTSFSAHEAIIQNANCAPASQPVDVWLMSYAGSTQACPGEAAPLAVQIMNLGTEPLTSCTIEISNLSGTLATSEWNGALETYEMAVVDLGSATFNNTGFFFVELTSPDGNATNNSLTATMNVNAAAATTLFQVALTTDDFPGETGWFFRDSEGTTVASSPQDLVANTPYTWWVNLPSTGCYSFHLTDSYGDGLSGSCAVTTHLEGGWPMAQVFAHNGTGAFSEKSKGLHVQDQVVSVGSADLNLDWRCFPNPLSPHDTHLFIESGVRSGGPAGTAPRVQVFDAQGRLFHEALRPDAVGEHGARWAVPAAHWPAGLYLVRLIDGGAVKTASCIKS